MTDNRINIVIYPGACGNAWPDFRAQPWCSQPYGHLDDHDRPPWDIPGEKDS